MAEITEVRNAVLKWAAENGVLANVAQGDPGAGLGDSSILPFEAEHADYFRTRKIMRVVADRNTLSIYSRLKVAKTKIKKLKSAFDNVFKDDGIRLEVGISIPFKVDQSLEVYGPLVPIHRTRGGKLACGSSVGLGNQRNAGTLTAFAHRPRGDGSLFGLSCNHVVGGCSTALPGTPVVIPGIQDVSSEHPEINVIGVHYAAAPMAQGLPSVSNITNNFDLACFQLPNSDRVSSIQGSGEGAYDTPTTYAKVKNELPVKKWGRSTRLTRGRVSNIITGGYPVDYQLTSYYGPHYSQVFKGTVYYYEVYEITPRGGPFSLGGDSGALVVTDDNKAEKIVGIVVGGGREKSLVLPIKPMLNVLGLALIGGLNAS